MVVDGAPQVLEFNVRFGDPETEVLMARWKGDVLGLFESSARGDLTGVAPA
jgi:phosphoribosylamine--glycine ligase